MVQDKAKDADGLTPVKDDNAGRRYLRRRTSVRLRAGCSQEVGE